MRRGKIRQNTPKGTPVSDFTMELPDGTVLDIDSFNWGGLRLTDKQKRFCFWYTYPGTRAYHNKAESGRKAGYAENTTKGEISRIFQKEAVQKAIKMFEDSIVKTAVAEAYQKLILQKITRAGFDIKDFYRNVTFTNKDGYEESRLELIPIDKLTDEQRICIDGIDYKGQTGIPAYMLANRSKEASDIISLHERLNGKTGSDDYDVETTIDVIKNKLATVRTTVRKRNEKISQTAEDYRQDDDVPEYD